ncbi:MAG: pectate lyase [Paludibacteraceae bacterium]|nr:pectate lyase [Paludibacteraceae bacterium]
MRKWIYTICFLLVLVACKETKTNNDIDPRKQKVPAFPGAEGGGCYTVGGRSANVFVVNSLEDDAVNPDVGTLRYALNQNGSRIIVFRISGCIHLKAQLNINKGNVTIMGQSAPGDGICIADYPVIIKTDNVILRFLRFRMGDLKGKEGDALTCEEGHKDIIIDHCSCSWSTDECVSTYGVTNFTLQYCLISESLNNSVHAKGAHGYGGIWGGRNATYHHNLLAHHNSRMPRFDHEYVDNSCFGPLDFVNNVVYNWGSNSAYGGEGISQSRKINYVNNYYKPGKATHCPNRLLNITTYCGYCNKTHPEKVIPGTFYLTGNYLFDNDTIINDNWKGVIVDEKGKYSVLDCRTDMRWTEGLTMLQHEQSAQEAYETVLAKVGCSLHQDVVDARIINEVRTGTYTHEGTYSTGGLIDTPSDVGGWPEYKTYDVKKDSDYDNIPDDWEIENGLDPNNGEDAKLATLFPPYMNIEVYLNDLVKHLY